MPDRVGGGAEVVPSTQGREREDGNAPGESDLPGGNKRVETKAGILENLVRGRSTATGDS